MYMYTLHFGLFSKRFCYPLVNWNTIMTMEATYIHNYFNGTRE